MSPRKTVGNVLGETNKSARYIKDSLSKSPEEVKLEHDKKFLNLAYRHGEEKSVSSIYDSTGAIIFNRGFELARGALEFPENMSLTPEQIASGKFHHYLISPAAACIVHATGMEGLRGSTLYSPAMPDFNTCLLIPKYRIKEVVLDAILMSTLSKVPALERKFNGCKHVLTKGNVLMTYVEINQPKTVGYLGREYDI